MEGFREALFEMKKNDKKYCGVMPFLTAGYPNRECTVPYLLALQEGGAVAIELGVPYSDPQADGPTIQHSSYVALNEQRITPQDCIDMVADARNQGLTVPVILMGYYNPILQFGEEEFVLQSKTAGVNGFIVVDLPIDEDSLVFRTACSKHQLCFIPIITPTTDDERLIKMNKVADTFCYAVSRNAVTGRTESLNENLMTYIKNVRKHVKKFIGVGFGINNKSDYDKVAKVADVCIIGSRIIRTIESYDVDDIEGVCQGLIQFMSQFAPQVTQSTTDETGESCIIS